MTIKKAPRLMSSVRSDRAAIRLIATIPRMRIRIDDVYDASLIIMVETAAISSVDVHMPFLDNACRMQLHALDADAERAISMLRCTKASAWSLMSASNEFV